MWRRYCPVSGSVVLASLLMGSLPGAITAVYSQNGIVSRVSLDDPEARDQDDMCIWIHPTDPNLSTVITSDKQVDKLFVYDLQGNTVQVVSVVGQPGNIDLRHNVSLAGELVDIVAFNDRVNNTIQVFRVDPISRELWRVDDGSILTNGNYGLCLYRSTQSNAMYVFTTVQSGLIEQHELRDEAGQISGRVVRSWDIGGQTEGCVCDDETGFAYFGEEDVGIWKVGAEPSDPVAGSLIASVGDASGLTADVEGLTIYYAAGGQGYLIASSQGSSEFKVYERAPPHDYVETFTVADVGETDGVDVTNVSLGTAFPSGVITVHNHLPTRKTVEVCAYEDAGLRVDTQYWDPRADSTTATLIGLISAQAEQGVVRLAWYAADAQARTATVYRRSSVSQWMALSEVHADGSGHIVFEDRGVEGGDRYGYRLGVRSGAAEEFMGEVWVDVPENYRLALGGARPNPITRELIVSFSLPDGRAAMLEVYDAAGRRVLERRIDPAVPGSHLLNLGNSAKLNPGLYLIRLIQGPTSLTRRVVVIR